jgi:putative ABC transport system permease protein
MIDNLYKSERRLGRVVLYFTVLSIFIACLGLFGLASYTAEQKTKEIGIRKVMGATVPNLVLLLSRQFGKLILIANLIAWPLAYFALRAWLNDFYYRVSIGIDAFVLSSAAVLAIAFLSIAYQSIRAALTDPAEAIRYE